MRSRVSERAERKHTEQEQSGTRTSLRMSFIRELAVFSLTMFSFTCVHNK
jgi:hypothetical protein